MRLASLALLLGVSACYRQPGSSGPMAPQPMPEQPPAAQAMDPALAVGLYRTNFGPVKIQEDDSAGAGNVMGVWVYDRGGEEVVGYFAGPLDGNVLSFRWQEPAQPAPLTGSGYLVFSPDGGGFTGRWWTAARDRSGEFTGERAQLTSSQ